MAQTIDARLMAIHVQKISGASHDHQKKSVDRLSSGLRVDSASDDAAALAVAEPMSSMIRGMNVGMRNAYHGISMTQTADSGLGQVNDMLQRMRELAIKSANATTSSADREKLNAEFSALNEGISRIASTTSYNGAAIFAGNGGSVDFQVGPNAQSVDTITVDLVNIEALSANLSTSEASMKSVEKIDAMKQEVARWRASFSAVHDRFESAIEVLQTDKQTQTPTRGRISDADFALETAMLTRSQIVEQASIAMSSQANSSAQNVMNLLN